MFAREITPEAVREVVATRQVVEEYPQDRPYPSQLLLGFVDGRAIHVVVASDAATGRCYVVTAYPPDPERWDRGFMRRRE
jgi:hypothetical protein